MKIKNKRKFSFFSESVVKGLKKLFPDRRSNQEQQVAVFVEIDPNSDWEEVRNVQDDSNSEITMVDRENNDVIEIVLENRRDVTNNSKMEGRGL